MPNTRLPGQIIRSGSVPTTALGGGVISSSAQVISSLPAGTVSSSGQVSYTGLSNIPSGIISSSAQVTGLLPAGTVSSSAQVSYTGLSNIPSDILSSSAQINNLSGVSASFASTAPYTGLIGLPSLVSSSAQVQLSSITGTTFAASDFTFPQNVSISGTVTAKEFYTQVVSSSIIYQSGSTKFGDTVDDVMSVTGSIGISGSMIISSSGRVGIGTTTPSTLLHVQGVISSSTVTSSGDLSVAGLRVGRGGGAQSSNVAFGLNALSSNTAGTINAAVGYNALSANTLGSYNVAVGYAALQNNTTATNNTAIGYAAGLSITSGSENIAIGNQALYSNQTGQRIIAIGNLALYNSTVQENVAVGYVAGRYMTTGTYNTLVGNYAGGTNIVGSNNAALGQSALQFANTSYNTAVGSYSLFSLVSTNGFTTAVGANAGYYITSGSHNTILGVFDGNQDGIDIRTANYNITIADGNSKVRLYYDGTSNYWAFRTGASNLTSTEKMRIADSGNVGIGTTSPSNLLHLKASTNPVIRLEGASDSGYVDYNGTRLQLSAGGGDMYLVAGNSEKVRITNTGNVGIGITSPTAKLHVSGGATFNLPAGSSIVVSGPGSNTIAQGPNLYFEDNSVAATATALQQGASGRFGIWTYDSSWGERFSITKTGNVGIGTTSPTAKLVVNGSNNAGLSLAVNGSDTEGTIAKFARGGSEKNFYVNTTDNQYATLATEGNFRFKVGITTDQPYTTGTTAVVISGSGNVGIGTSSPAVPLHVDATSGGIVRVARSSAGAGTFQMEADGTDGTLAATNTMRLRAGGTERITVLSTGNVGIGTTNPSTLLDVSGSSTFRGAMQQGSIYRYGTFNIISVAVDSTGWIKLATVATNAITKFFMRNGSNNSEEVIEFDVYATYVQAKNYVNVTRQTYYQHVLEIRITGNEGGNPTVYVRCRTSDFAPTFSWQIASAWYLPVPTIHNIEETPGSGPSFLLSGVGYFNSAPVASFTGSLGIGTISPTGILHTAGSGNQTVYFTHTDNVPGRTVTLRLGSDNATYINRSTFIQAIQGSGIDNYALAFGTTSGTDASAQTRMFISTTGHILIGTTNVDVGGTVTGSAFRPDGQLLVSNNKTDSISSYVYYGDRRGTNNTGPVYTLAMGGYLKADIGVAGTNASTDDGVITFNTISGNATRTERMRIRYDGNVGIGTTSPTTKLEISDIAPVLRVSGLDGSKPQLQISSVGVVNWALRANFNNASDFTIYQDSTQRMQIDSSGRLLVGYTINQDGAALQVDANSVSSTVYSARIVNSSTSTTAYNVMRFIQGAAGSATGMIGTGGSATANVGFQNTFVVGTQTSHALVFMTNDAERARITTGGDIRFGVAATNYGVLDINVVSGTRIIDAVNVNGNRYFEVQTDGDVYNTNGTYGVLSDATLKQDIIDAPSQWNDIKAIQFRKYRMKTDVQVNPEAPYLLGVVAQELEQVSPGLVDEHPNDDGTTTKTVKSSILLMKAAVALQEAMSRIEVLEQEIRQLKGS